MKKILITGKNGFVGRELVHSLSPQNYQIVGFQRNDDFVSNPSRFDKLDVVIHLAGKAHDRGATWEDFERDNVKLTRDLILTIKTHSPQARLIFLSSAKVYGENSTGAFSENSPTEPQSLYGKSKLMAEQVVKESGVSYIIFRPTLIFSESAKGNLQALRKISKLGIPLPSNIHNHRSLATLSFVVKKIIAAMDDQLPWNEIYNLCDLNLSTSEIFRLNGVNFLLPYPKMILNWMPLKFQQKLLLDLELDNSKISSH
jgi:nucleoside-diphosphate-sugar epimerase